MRFCFDGRMKWHTTVQRREKKRKEKKEICLSLDTDETKVDHPAGGDVLPKADNRQTEETILHGTVMRMRS